MNWDAIGASAELVAAVGVIASLLYLAGQIRQSNATNRLSATLSLQASYNQIVEFWFGNPEKSKIARTGLDGLEGLTDHERLQFSAQLFTLYGFTETVFNHHERGLVDDHLWNRVIQVIVFYRAFPGIQQWWTGTDLLLPGRTVAARDAFSPEFRSIVDL